MKKKTRSKSRFWGRIRQFLPYVAVFLAILSVAKIGADTKLANNSSLNVNNIASDDYNVSADQLSELYVVASLSSSFNLASVETVSGNYVTVSVMKEISQTSTDLIEKPNFVGTNISRGVQTYTVKDGETMASIAAAFGLTTDQIRWSNDLKTTDVSPGQTLVLPVGVAGIVYTVKAGDTPDSLAQKYGSNAAEIIAYMREHCAKGNTVFFSSHNLDLVKRLCHRVAIINEGHLIDCFDLAGNEENKANLEERFFKITGTYERRLFEDYVAQEQEEFRPDLGAVVDESSAAADAGFVKDETAESAETVSEKATDAED